MLCLSWWICKCYEMLNIRSHIQTTELHIFREHAFSSEFAVSIYYLNFELFFFFCFHFIWQVGRILVPVLFLWSHAYAYYATNATALCRLIGLFVCIESNEPLLKAKKKLFFFGCWAYLHVQYNCLIVGGSGKFSCRRLCCQVRLICSFFFIVGMVQESKSSSHVVIWYRQKTALDVYI